MKRHKLWIALGTLAFLCAVSLTPTARAQEMPKEYQEVLSFLGKKGDFSAGVFKVNLPRNDLQVRIAGRLTPTPFGFGGWVGFTKDDAGTDVMMGDLVLLQEEVNPVMSALLDHGLEVTALHNHFFWEEPRLFFMHIHGRGKAMDIARRVKPALDLIGHVVPIPPPPAPAAATGRLDTEKLACIVGHPGEQLGPVYKITIGRNDLSVKEMGATINARMGLNTWAAFAGTDDDAQIAGDVAMLDTEVNAVLKALRSHDLRVVAVHHHMLATRPTIFFLHYWGQGPAGKLAAGFRAALDQTTAGEKPSGHFAGKHVRARADKIVFQALPAPAVFRSQVPQAMQAKLPPDPTPFGNQMQSIKGSIVIEAWDRTETSRPEPPYTDDAAKVTAKFSTADGARWKVVQTAIAGRQSDGSAFLFGGLGTDVVVHGDTGKESPLLPKMRAALTMWGPAKVFKNGKLVKSDALLHIMITSRAHTEPDFHYTDYDATAGPVDEIHLLVDPQNQLPAPGGYLHIMWERAEVTAETIEPGEK